MRSASDMAIHFDGKIRDYFLPGNALQGEEIPTYILWRDIEYDKIEVMISNNFELKDIYNVNDNNYEKIDNKIIINSVEVDGYLGILLGTVRSNELLINSDVKYTFLKDENIVYELICETILFRPELKIKYIPDVINIRKEIIPNDKKINLENIGEGTLMIKFLTTENSEAKLYKPKRMREFISGYTATFNEGIEKMEDKYENYNNFFEDLKYVVNTPFDPGDEKILSEFKYRTDRMDDTLSLNENLSKEVLRVLVYAFLKNISILTVMERFLDYLRSIARNRVRILNPLDTIKLSKGDNTIELVINNTDLLQSTLNPIRIKPFKINCDKELDLPIYDFFQWSEGDENDI